MFSLSEDSIRLNLTIPSQSNEKIPNSYQLIVDGQETSISLPWITKDFPLVVTQKLIEILN